MSTTYDDTCQCADCQNYRNYVENSSSGSRGEPPSVECNNKSFHQTFLCSKSSLLSTKWPSLPSSIFAINNIRSKHSASTGRIPQTSSRDVQANDRSHSSPNIIPQCTCQPQNNRPIVYVTFAESSKRHEDEVVDLCHLCEGAGFTVKCDSYRALQENGELNVNQWRDENFRRAACVLFCISPAYCRLINKLEEPQAVAEESDHSKGAVYIYNLARAELVDSLCSNRRFFCVLFTNSKAGLRIPRCFTPYTKFSFPGESQILVRAMQTCHSPNQTLH